MCDGKPDELTVGLNVNKHTSHNIKCIIFHVDLIKER